MDAVIHLLIKDILDEYSKSLVSIINMVFPRWHSEEV